MRESNQQPFSSEATASGLTTWQTPQTLIFKSFVLTGYDQFIRIRSLPYVIPIAQTGLMGSIYCTMALTLERFFAVCHPFLPRRYELLKSYSHCQAPLLELVSQALRSTVSGFTGSGIASLWSEQWL